MLTQLKKMQSQAGNHQSKLEEIVQNLADGSDELDSNKGTGGCTRNSSKVFKYDADLSWDQIQILLKQLNFYVLRKVEK